MIRKYETVLKNHASITLICLLMSGFVYAVQDEPMLEERVVEQLADRLDDEYMPEDLFTLDELVVEQQLVKEQEQNITTAAWVVATLQRFAGKLFGPFFYLWYKISVWKESRT